MTNEAKRAIWRATYASAFVEQMRQLQAAGAGFDRAMEGNAEAAITIADEAVRQLEEWEQTEGKAQP